MFNPDYFDKSCPKCGDTVRELVKEYTREYEKLKQKADKLAECLSEMMNDNPSSETIKKSLQILKEYMGE